MVDVMIDRARARPRSDRSRPVDRSARSRYPYRYRSCARVRSDHRIESISVDVDIEGPIVATSTIDA